MDGWVDGWMGTSDMHGMGWMDGCRRKRVMSVRACGGDDTSVRMMLLCITTRKKENDKEGVKKS